MSTQSPKSWISQIVGKAPRPTLFTAPYLLQILAVALFLPTILLIPSISIPTYDQGNDNTQKLAAEPLGESDDIKFDHVFNTETFNFSLAQDKDGFIWVSTAAGLFRYDGYEVTIYKASPNSLSSDAIPSILVDSEGLIWLGTQAGLNVLNKATNTFTGYQHDVNDPNSISSDNVNWVPGTIAEDGEGFIWVGTVDGLNRFDKQTDTFTRYKHDPADPNSLSANNIWSVHVDRDDVIWVGTEDGGLNRFDKSSNTFTHYRHDPDDPNSLSDDTVYAIAEDRDGVLWIGTRNGGLNRFDKDNDTFTHYRHNPDDPDSLAHDEVAFILEDRESNLWIGRTYLVEVGAEKFERETETFIHYHHTPDDVYSLSENRITSYFEDRAGILWVVGNGGAIDKYDRQSQRFHLYTQDPNDNRGLPTNNVIAIAEDHDRNIWFAAYPGGLVKYNRETDDFATYRHDPNNPDSLPGNGVYSIFEDSSGNFWVGTDEGVLSLFDRESVKVIERYQNPVAALGIVGLTEDKTNPNWLWFGTESDGIFLFDKTAGAFKQYQHSPDNPDNLSNNVVHHFCQDDAGGLWVATLGGGLNKFNRETETFTHYKNDSEDLRSIGGNTVNGCYIDSAGRFWLVTEDGGLNQFDKETGTFRRYGEAHGFTTNATRAILEDKAGYLWISSDAGIFKFDPDEETVVNIYVQEDGLQGNKFSVYPTSALITRGGEMWFAGLKGLDRFDPEQITDNPHIPPVMLTAFRSDGETMEFGRAIERVRQVHLNWPTNSFEFEFAALNYTLPEKNRYAYILEGFESEWNDVGTRRYGKYTNIPGGEYTLRIKGANNDNVWNEDGTSIEIVITPPWWETMWFRGLVLALVAGLVFGGYRWRVYSIEQRNRQLEQEVAERTRELRESEARFRAFFDHSPVGLLIWDTSDPVRYVAINDTLAALNGLPAEEHIGKTIGQVFDDEKIAQDHDELLKNLIRTKQPVTLESSGLNLQGKVVHYFAQHFPLLGAEGKVTGIGSVVLDLTERKQAERQLRLLGQIAQQMRDAVILTDVKSRIVYVNDAFSNIYGYTKDEILGEFSWILFAGDDAERERVSRDREEGIAREGQCRIEYRDRRKDGSVFWVSNTLSVVHLGETEEPYNLGIVRDITERKQAEEELREAKETAEEARRTAEAANQAKSVFLTNMSHELRTPLNAILGFSELMMRDPNLTSDQRENLATIGRSGEHLLALINDVLDLSKIEAGRIELQPETFDLHRMLLGLGEMFRLRTDAKGLSLVFDLAPDVPQFVRADQDKLRQVLINLLGNAVKFTHKGSVTLRVRQIPNSEFRILNFKVEDTGVGIAPDEMDKIFDAFVQTESGKQSEQGTGLGLAISSQYVQMMGGDISVTSELDKGSCFQFDVPVEVVDAAEVEIAQPAHRVIGLEPGHPVYRLLVVDDMEASRRLLAQLLQSFADPAGNQGFEVREAVNGQEAIAIWGEWKPHLIWMDMRMPVLDGREATRRIKATPQGQETVIVALTASAFEEDRAAALAAGCNGFVRKPFREADIFDILTRHLGVRFVYQEMGREDRDRDREGEEEVLTLVGMDSEWLADLHRATLMGDLEWIESLIEQIQALYPVRAGRLADLAHNFEHREILSLIERATQG